MRGLGVVPGITIRLRSVMGNPAVGLQMIFSGNTAVFTELREHARQKAYPLLLQHVQVLGANAIIGIRFGANDVMEGCTEVLGCGTAVVVGKS